MIFPNRHVIFRITDEDETEAIELEKKLYMSRTPIYAAHTVDPVTRALKRLGFTGVETHVEYVTLTSPRLRRIQSKRLRYGSLENYLVKWWSDRKSLKWEDRHISITFDLDLFYHIQEVNNQSELEYNGTA